MVELQATPDRRDHQEPRERSDRPASLADRENAATAESPVARETRESGVPQDLQASLAFRDLLDPLVCVRSLWQVNFRDLANVE